MHEVIADSTAKGPYSTVIRAGDFVYISGQGGIDPETGKKAVGGFAAETRMTLMWIEKLLAEAGLRFENLIQLTCYLTDLEDWPTLNEVSVEVMGAETKPTRTAVGVASLPFDLSLEVTAVAYAGA